VNWEASHRNGSNSVQVPFADIYSCINLGVLSERERNAMGLGRELILVRL